MVQAHSGCRKRASLFSAELTVFKQSRSLCLIGLHPNPREAHVLRARGDPQAQPLSSSASIIQDSHRG